MKLLIIIGILTALFLIMSCQKREGMGEIFAHDKTPLALREILRKYIPTWGFKPQVSNVPLPLTSQVRDASLVKPLPKVNMQPSYRGKVIHVDLDPDHKVDPAYVDELHPSYAPPRESGTPPDPDAINFVPQTYKDMYGWEPFNERFKHPERTGDYIEDFMNGEAFDLGQNIDNYISDNYVRVKAEPWEPMDEPTDNSTDAQITRLNMAQGNKARDSIKYRANYGTNALYKYFGDEMTYQENNKEWWERDEALYDPKYDTNVVDDTCYRYGNQRDGVGEFSGNSVY